MACTTQSAVEYVEAARPHLVRELKSLSLIVENLYQQGVFNKENVKDVEAEKQDFDKVRTLLDSVIKKGEAACYKLLRIIDLTRKRTLERTPLPPHNDKFDLHHWISCYPFREDTETHTNYLQGPRPCHSYQAKLKSKVRKISNEFWMANKILFEGNNKPDLSYTPLVLDTQEADSPSKIKKFKIRKCKKNRSKKHRTYLPEDRAGISPSDLLKTDENILVVGKPGIGKTALTHELLKLWAERDNKELDYMFYFGMEETLHITKAMSLEELLFSVFSEPDEGREEVLEDIKKNSDNVTIIFDGITDFSSSVVKKLVERELLPLAKVIITCRPDDEDGFSHNCRSDDKDGFSGKFLRVEVKGFGEQTIRRFLCAMLGEAQEQLLNVELLTLCHVPLYAMMVAACLSFQKHQDCPQPGSITEIYINIVRFCLQTISKTQTKHLNSFISNKKEEILSLAQVAFHATEGKSVNLTGLSCEDSCVLSFLKPLVRKVAVTETETTYAFLHYTMQEFFAALWLLKNPDKIKAVFQQCLTEDMKHMRYLIPFMCRLLSQKSPTMMECLIPAQELKKTSEWFFEEMMSTFSSGLGNKDEADVDVQFLCQCLYESQCPEACVSSLDKLDYSLDLSGESLDPYHCCAVAYVISQSKQRKVLLDLEEASVQEQGMRQLYGCLQHVQWVDPLPQQLWEIFLLSGSQMDPVTLLRLDGNRLHLPVEGRRRLFERSVQIMQQTTTKVSVCLYWASPNPACRSLCESLREALPNISSLCCRMSSTCPGSQEQQQCRRAAWGEKRLLLDLCETAALHEGESFNNTMNTLLSLFSVNIEFNDILDFYQCTESEGYSRVIPKLRHILQSAPAAWSIDLSERKSSILLEVLKLQPEKKRVKLTGCLHEESEVRSFLQCLPHISQLSCDPQFFQTVCAVISGPSRVEAEQLSSLLKLLGFSLQLSAELSRKTCSSVGRVLKLCSSDVDLILTPTKMSVRGAAVLFRQTTQLHSLRLSSAMVLLLSQWVRRERVACPLTVEQLCVSPHRGPPSQRVSVKLVSGLASLLRYWTVRRLDLTDLCVSAQCLIPLLLHDGPLTIKLSEEMFQELLFLLPEIQDKHLTCSFLSKLGGELSSCRLNWDLLHHLLQQSSPQTITVNMRKNLFLQNNIHLLLPFLDRIVFKRPCPSFVLSAIREIHSARATSFIPSLLRSLDHVISLTCREMDSADCAALLFTLKHSDRVKLDLLWTSIPAQETDSILPALDKVSELSIDRNLLLKFIHCCAASDAQQGAAVHLLRTLQHRLDLSCSSCVDLQEERHSDTLSLTDADCRAVSTVLRRSSRDTQLHLQDCELHLQDCELHLQDCELHLQDCELQDSGLELLFPVLDRIRLRASKAVLLRLVSLVPVGTDGDTATRAESLRAALGGELDLSHTTLDQRACGCLALMLKFSEGLTELDLSHCGLTDLLLLTLATQLHKVQVLDLSHNRIGDASAPTLVRLVSTRASVGTVRLFGNNIVDRKALEKEKKVELW